jgi:hypothetical protein
MQPTITVDEAQRRVTAHVASIPPLAGARIGRAVQLDCAGFYAFAVTAPAAAGFQIFLVDDQALIGTGQPEATFAEVARRMAAAGEIPDVHRFAQLFLNLRALRPGVVLDAPDTSPLVRPEDLPGFAPPSAETTATGTRYRFWALDTRRGQPGFWDVELGRDGAVTLHHAASPC